MSKKQTTVQNLLPAKIFQRGKAFLFDAFFTATIMFIIFWIILALPESIRKPNSGNLAIIFVLLLIIYRPAYEILLYTLRKQSLGKRLFGIKVVDFKTQYNLSFGRIALREIVKYIFYAIFSIIALTLEIIKVNKDPNHRSLIDRLVNTQVISLNRSNKKGNWFLLMLILIDLIIFILFWVWLFMKYSN